MKPDKRNTDLVKIADLRYQSVQFEMAVLLEQEYGLRANLQQLTAQKQAAAITMETGNDYAVAAGVDLRWHHWVDQRRAVINMELAKVLAQQAELRLRLRQAFGKSQVAQAIATQSAMHARQVKARRGSYES